MNEPRLYVRKLVEKALAGGGQLPLALLLEVLVPVKTLRQLARDHGITPKGGFRLDKAPAHVLAPPLAELGDAARVDAVITALARSVGGEPAAAEKPDAPETSPLLALKDCVTIESEPVTADPMSDQGPDKFPACK